MIGSKLSSLKCELLGFLGASLVLAGCAGVVPASNRPIGVGADNLRLSACCPVTLTVSFQVPQPGDTRMVAARIAFTQAGHPSRSGTVRLVPANKLCARATAGITCELAFSLYSGTANYKLQLLDTRSRVTFTRSATTATSVGLAFVLANRYTSAAVSFDDPVMGAPSQVTLQVTPLLEGNGYGGIPVSVDPFAKPIRLEDSDKSGVTKLSTSAVYSSGQTATLAYDGKTIVNPTIEAKPSAAYPQRLVPILHSTEWALPGKRQSSTLSGFGRMYLNSNGSITFLAHESIDTVTRNGHIVEQPLPGYEYDIAEGPDGLTWTIYRTGSTYVLARVNANGTLTSFPLRGYNFGTFVLGPDKQFWVSILLPTQRFVVRRISAQGKISNFTAPAGLQGLNGPSAGPAHSVWFAACDSTASGGGILQVRPTGRMTEYTLPASSVRVITNVVWGGGRWLYAVAGGENLMRVSPGQKPEVFPAPLNMESSAASPPIDPPLAFGPDGAMWYVAQSLDAGLGCNVEIGRVTTAGKVANAQLASTCTTTFPILPTAFVAGADKTLWYTRGSSVGKVSL